MDSITREAWERFYDRVVVRGRNWPRSLWFAAVEDGLRAGLPPESPLLAQFRQDVAELMELERAGLGAQRDAARVQQLEAEIKRLIAIADQTVRELAEQRPAGPARTGWWLGALMLGTIMFCGALLGITYYQQQRASERMQLELAALQQRLIEQAADQRAALEARVRSVDRVRENLDALQGELRSNVDEFNRLMSASLRSLAALGKTGVADADGALPAGNEDNAGALGERTAALERQLAELEGALGALAARLPQLDGGITGLAERVEAAAAAFERTESQVATLQAKAPELALWLEGQRQALAQDLARIKQQGADLEQALGEVGSAEQQANDLVSQVDAALGMSRDGVQERLDELVAEVSEQAERSARVLQQAEAEAIGRIDAATGQAIEELGKARDTELAELRRWASEVKAELEQTRAALTAGWRELDEAVAARHAEALGDLDRYAATLEARVQEFLKALDGIVARTSG